MDPDANLAEQRELISAIENLADADDRIHDAQIVEQGIRLAELVRALDDWITHGGFLPARWQRGRS